MSQQPFTITFTLETPDDFRYFYHLMNFQMKEIKAAYSESTIGSFEDRFHDFAMPDKSVLFKQVKEEMKKRGISP